MGILIALRHETIILDACCAITLYESGHIEEILRATGKQSAIASYVLEDEIKQADLRWLVDSGMLQVVTCENEAEENTFVDFAVEMEDGEAVTGAIAMHRNWAIATDEIKAIRFFAKVVPQLAIVTTPALVKN